ncbi:MAG: ferritin family protein [Deltaproteobacteria bacterium]|nr:ferritin family protein [Deltaproteobacteria bacterium]
MVESSTLDILKAAILLERRGKAFYQMVADKAQGEAVKEFFQMMADEEEEHIQQLSEQFRAYQQTNKFAPKNYREEAKDEHEAASKVLTEKLKTEITAASFEAAAIAAAVQMEKRAIDLYSERAKTAEDLQEKALYQWLSTWEVGHLESLNKLDQELTEAVWGDNNFWPM